MCGGLRVWRYVIDNLARRVPVDSERLTTRRNLQYVPQGLVYLQLDTYTPESIEVGLPGPALATRPSTQSVNDLAFQK